MPWAESESGYKVGPGRPPLHTRFKKGQSGNPGGRGTKSLPALLADALNETVVMTIDGRRRKLTKREAIVTQMVDIEHAWPREIFGLPGWVYIMTNRPNGTLYVGVTDHLARRARDIARALSRVSQGNTD